MESDFDYVSLTARDDSQGAVLTIQLGSEIADSFEVDVATWRKSGDRLVQITLNGDFTRATAQTGRPTQALTISGDASEVLSFLTNVLWVMVEETFDLDHETVERTPLGAIHDLCWPPDSPDG